MYVHTVRISGHLRDCTINNIQLEYYYCSSLYNSHNKESCQVIRWNGMDNTTNGMDNWTTGLTSATLQIFLSSLFQCLTWSFERSKVTYFNCKFGGYGWIQVSSNKLWNSWWAACICTVSHGGHMYLLQKHFTKLSI